MNQDGYQQLSISSQLALEWAFTRMQLRSSSDKESLRQVSAIDLLVGTILSHQNNLESSEPLQLCAHFRIPLQLLYDMLRTDGGFAPNDAPSSRETLKDIPSLDSEADSILGHSFELSQKFNPESEHLVRHRDLFGGILMTSNRATRLLQEVLATAGIAIEQLIGTYTDFLHYPEKSIGQFLAEGFSAPEKPTGNDEVIPTGVHFAVSGFSADTRTEEDLIGIGSEVDAFAYLIAAKALQPPMAIGLFGDWGAGKSFFMEALRKRIHKITVDARSSKEPQEKISIYKYVAQIEFNAWHYVEGELWASLVEHIFRNLKTRPEDEPTLLQQRQQHVIEKLEERRREQCVAQARKTELETELAKTRERVRDLERARQDALKKLNDVKAKDILETVALSDTEKGTLNDLGVKGTFENAAELMRGADELRAVLERGNALITPLRERGWKWAAMLILVILIGPATSLALSSIGKVPAVTNALASVSLFLSGVTVVLKQGTAWLSGALARVERTQAQLETKRKEAEKKYAYSIAEAERKYNEKAKEYDEARNEEKEKAREIAEIEQELQCLTPGRVLLDFISERVGSPDYRKHLGIAALIRNDFEQLSQLIAEQNKEFTETDDGTIREKDGHLINRIVLYIDDLDRCPPKRVVQVLQAVHLLLAFPLFVVVVAVDARWLAQSLQSHYRDLLATSTMRDGLDLSKGFGRQATPQDYLEKIFQIPFWVRPLPEKARMRIVKGLVKDSFVVSGTGKMDAGEKESVAEPGGADDKGAVKAQGEWTAVQWEASERRRPLDLEGQTDLRPQGLDIEKIEYDFMEELRTLLGQTPRSVKRFVNSYRLIKAVSIDRVARFVEDKPDADFKYVLFLLAVLTGLPTISREFFRLLRSERSEIEQAQNHGRQVDVPSGRTVAQVLEALRAIVSDSPQPLSESTVVEEQGLPATSKEAVSGPERGSGYDDWYACRDFDRLESWLNEYESGSWMSCDATALADWAPQVVRFSYRIEEL